MPDFPKRRSHPVKIRLISGIGDIGRLRPQLDNPTGCSVSANWNRRLSAALLDFALLSLDI